MNEFICGFFFFITGAALLIYNKPLVNRSSEFHRVSSPAEAEEMILFNRVLCVLAGLFVSIVGFLMMLTGKLNFTGD